MAWIIVIVAVTADVESRLRNDAHVIIDRGAARFNVIIRRSAVENASLTGETHGWRIKHRGEVEIAIKSEIGFAWKSGHCKNSVPKGRRTCGWKKMKPKTTKR